VSSSKRVVKNENVMTRRNELCHSTYSLDVGDYDLDGDIDILIGNTCETNQVYENTAKGSVFIKHELSQHGFNTYDIKFVDINGDQKLDIVEANSDKRNVYYRNRQSN